MFLYKSLLHASGRHGPKSYIIGLLVFVVIYWPQRFLINPILDNIWGFLLSIFAFVLNCYILYSLFAKRLHDMGRSVWALTAMITLELIVIIGTMMAFGGAEYFSAFYQFDRKEVIPEDVKQGIITAYQANIEAHITQITVLFWIVPVLFCLWLAVSKSQARENIYGPVPKL